MVRSPHNNGNTWTRSSNSNSAETSIAPHTPVIRNDGQMSGFQVYKHNCPVGQGLDEGRRSTRWRVEGTRRDVHVDVEV